MNHHIIRLTGKSYDYSHFIGVETETKRVRKLAQGYSSELEELRFEPRQVYLTADLSCLISKLYYLLVQKYMFAGE